MAVHKRRPCDGETRRKGAMAALKTLFTCGAAAKPSARIVARRGGAENLRSVNRMGSTGGEGGGWAIMSRRTRTLVNAVRDRA